jgi:Tol biopolymer transport system component/DNA-binding winged helix-turn-helix (wHTH) protein
VAEKKLSSPSGVLRFGVFQANLAARELGKHGVRIRLPGQAFCILSMLLEKPGEIVTREEMRQRLWASDTFVDFEHSLNSAIKKLRAALNDTPENSRYIETVPRVGYRFIAPVSVLDSRHAENAAQAVAPEAEQLAVHPVPSGLIPKPGGIGLSSAAEHKGPFLFLQSKPFLVVVGTAALLGAVYLLRPTVAPPRVVRIRQITHLGTVESRQNLVTDGPRIYFRDRTAGKRSLKYVASDGGEASLLPNSSSEFDIDGISPDGAELLVSSVTMDLDNPLWALSPGGGGPRRLGNTMSIDSEWSPDGRRLAYMTAEGSVYLANADGSESRKLADVPGTPFCPRWSPDSRRLRFIFIRSETNTNDLWEVATNGTGGAHPLLPGWGKPESEWGGSWSPDGKYYFFSSSVQGVKCVWALREKTDWWHKVSWVPVQLTSGPINYSLPRTSRDGKTLFVVGEERRGQLLRYGSKSGNFEPFAGGISADHVSFSRDSQWMAYVSYPDGTLWRSKLDGTQRLQLSFSPLRAYVPRWSPDGKWIAFAGSPDAGQKMKLYRVPANGLRPPEQLLPAEGGESYPGWSPDGNHIVFGRAMDPVPPDNLDILVLDMETGKVSQIPGSHGLFEPQWSPDGRYLVGVSADHDRLMLFEFQTKQWTSLGIENAHYPSWSDDDHIYYFEMPDNFSQEEEWNANRLRLSDRKVEKLCSLHGLNLTGVYGWWSGPAPDGSPLALSDTSRRDIYAIDADLP